jgi:hypothetical protein
MFRRWLKTYLPGRQATRRLSRVDSLDLPKNGNTYGRKFHFYYVKQEGLFLGKF